MTQPVRDMYITTDLVERFADYYRRNLSWGVLHVSLDDGNYKYQCLPLVAYAPNDHTDEDREIAALHDRLTPSQRKRLGQKAERLIDRPCLGRRCE